MKSRQLFFRYFWRTGLWCLGIVILSCLLLSLLEEKSPWVSLISPFFMLLFSVPYALLGLIFGGGWIGRLLLYGSPWVLIPFWMGVTFCWNGLIGGLAALICCRIRKLQRQVVGHPAKVKTGEK